MSSDSKQMNAGTALPERFLWLPPVLLAAWRFYPITDNYFYGDDLYNLYEIVNHGLIEYLVKPYGMHLLAARNFVYFLSYRLFGTNAEPYFWIVLLTHLLNVFLLFQILRLLTGPRLACFGAALWGMSPVGEGALGWFSVYGQVQATTLILLVLYRLLRVAAGSVPAPGEPLLWGLLLLTASVSFGTGIGATMAFPVVAFVLLPPSPQRRRILLALVGVACTLPVLYLAAHRLAQIYQAPSTGQFGDAMGGIFQLAPVLGLTARLTAYGVTGLLLGPFRYPLPYPSPVADVVPVVVLIAVAAALALAVPARRRALLAVLVLGFACYGIIAAGRVGFFRLFGTGIIASARYHYAAPVPFCIAFFVALDTLAQRRQLLAGWRDAALAVGLLVLAVAHALTTPAIDHHARERMLAMKAVSSIHEQVDAAAPGTDVYLKNQRFTGVGPLMIQRPDLFPGLAGIFAVYFPDNTVDGRRVYFMIWDPVTLAAAQHGRRSSTFVVHPSQRPAEAAPDEPPPSEAPPREDAPPPASP